MTRVKQKCEDIKLGFAWEMGQEPLQSDNRNSSTSSQSELFGRVQIRPESRNRPSGVPT